MTSSIVTQRNIGSLLSIVTSVEPQSASAGTIAGASIDRVQHSVAGCCVVHAAMGAVSGGPSAESVIATLQHSPDNATWTNYLPDGVNAAATPAVAAANTEASLSVDLTAAYRYIRVSLAVAFTGGTTPAALVNADVVLSGENTLAAV